MTLKALINEQQIAYTQLKNNEATKFSVYVNLIRLVISGQSSSADKMITSTKLNDIVSTLSLADNITKAYRNLKTTLKNPKVKVGDLKTPKKKYYELLFSELLRIIDISGYRASVLATLFSSSKHGEITSKQQEIIYKFAKHLLTQTNELEGFDAKELHLILSSYESTDAVKSNSQINDVNNDQSQFTNMTNEELEKKENEITLKIEAATSGSKQKEKEIVSLSQELNFSGLSTEEFTNAKMINKILDTSIEPKAIEIKDKFMVLLNNLKTPFKPEQDIKLKKTLVVFVTDTISNFANNIPDIVKESNFEFILTYDRSTNSIIFVIEDIMQDLKFQRTFKLDVEGNIDTAVHNLFELPAKAQKTGLSKAIITDALKLYKSVNVNKIDLHANIGMGGYVWLRYGFKPYPDQLKHISDGFVDVSNSIRYGMKAGYTVGITPDIAFNSLIKHFSNPTLTSFLTEIKNNYSEVLSTVKEIWEITKYDASDMYAGPSPVTVNLEFHEVIGEVFRVIGTDVKNQFIINPDTLHEDIALTVLNVMATAPIVKIELDKRLPGKLRELVKAKLKKSSFPMAGKTKIILPIKDLLTVTGINYKQDKENGESEIITVFPGNPADWTKGIGTLPGALSWKGSLDINDDKQFNIALDYATAKK